MPCSVSGEITTVAESSIESEATLPGNSVEDVTVLPVPAVQGMHGVYLRQNSNCHLLQPKSYRPKRKVDELLNLQQETLTDGALGRHVFWIQLPTNDCFTAILTFYVFVMKFYDLWFMHVKTRLTSSRPNMKDGTATVASQQLVRDLL